MPIRTSYPHGTPNWLELHTDDHTAAKAFYGELFGWRFDAPEPATDPYARAYLGDAVVAAIKAPGADHAGSPAWVGYLAVDDVDTAVRAVGDAGGRVTVPPHDRADRGRAALVTDSTDAPVGLWQAYQQPGAAPVGEPATVAWFELLTDDTDAASAFYQQALGLLPHTADLGGIVWTTLHVGDDAVAGVVKKQVAGSPNRWNVYFATADIARDHEAGGRPGCHHHGRPGHHGDRADGGSPGPAGRPLQPLDPRPARTLTARPRDPL